MKVLLVNPAAERCVDTFMTPLGILSIASYLQKFNHTVKIYDREVSKQKFSKYLKEFSPDIVGVSVISGKAVKDALKVTNAAKTLGIKVVWGGLMPSCYPEFVLKESGADIVSVGEGEISWRDLLFAIENQKPLDTVGGIAYIKDGKLCQTKQYEPADLSEFPALDWTLVDVKKYAKSYYSCKKMLYMYASKGCPGNCTFCYNEFYNKSIHRRRPIETIISEIRYLIENFGMDGVYFADDLMFLTREEMRIFCSEINKSGLNFYWGGYSRIISSFNQEDYQYMYNAGCRWIYFGIETGSREMNRKIRKGIDFDKIIPTFEYCANAGIAANALFIIGFPEETEEELKKTVDLAIKINTSQKLFAYFTPISSSTLYNQLLANGKIKAPESLKDIARQKLLDRISFNFSCVPDTELRVIRSYFLLKRYVVKNMSTDKKPFSFTVKIILNSFKGLHYANTEIFSIAFEFIGYFIDITFHPGIRKKYGLK